MQLTVLGYNGPYPAPGGACSGYLITGDEGTNLLVDCGCGALPRLLEQLDIAQLDAVVLSHLHYDHISDMLPLRYLLDFSKRPALPLFCPREPEATFALLSGGKFEAREMTDATVGGLHLQFFPVRHPVPSYGLRVSGDGATLAYTGDSNDCEALPLLADRVNLLLADAGLTQNDWKPKAPHLSAAMCGQLARDARVQKLVLTHLAPRYAPSALRDEAREAFPEAILAQPGLHLRV